MNAVTEAFTATKEEAEVEHMKVLCATAEAEASQSTPLERVVVKHVGSLLASYREELGRLDKAHKQRRGALPEQGEDIDRIYESMKAGLVNDLDSHLAAVLPRPSLLPSTVTVEVHRNRDGHTSATDVFNITVTGASVPHEVVLMTQQRLNQKLDEKKDKLQSLDSLQLFVVDKAEQSSPLTFIDPANYDTPLTSLMGDRIEGAANVFRVEMQYSLASETAVCFSVEFVSGADMVVDYFRCETCNLNWVCRRCSERCHSGHEVVPYILAHKPTWACCYCAKKKKKTHCQLCSASGGV